MCWPGFRTFPIRAMLAIVVVAVFAADARARPADPGGRCVQAAEEAAARHGVPADLLKAIALVESGRARGGQLVPWPWTLNIEGKGFWFETRADALAHARRVLQSGRRSFDLGCYQINFHWHGEAFASLDAMLEPEAGANYAASFLRQLFGETGNWLRAAGHYHSRTPPLAERYLARVTGMLARIGGGPRGGGLTVHPGPAPAPAPVPVPVRVAQAPGPQRAMAASLFAGSAGSPWMPGAAGPADMAGRRAGALLALGGGGPLIGATRGGLLVTPPGPLVGSAAAARGSTSASEER